jgi:hypothetical protein
MTFNSAQVNASLNDAPMLWNIDSPKMVLEIQDDMKKRGVSKRVLFDSVDSSWTMIMQFNNVNQATRICAAAMFRDTAKLQLPKIIPTKDKQTIYGYFCKKYITESDDYHAELWVTDKINFNLFKIYELLSHCGMMTDFVRKGDWYRLRKIKGMVMQVKSVKKETGETYSVSISEIKPGIVTDSLFSLKGFRISEIPEGQSCGPTVVGK